MARAETLAQQAASEHASGPVPAVSVIVVNWNGRAYLEACLQTLRAQMFRDFEVIVVDNGSTDGSVELVKERFPEAALIPLPDNRGPCVANNAGIAQARGRYVAFLNNDVEADPGWLQALVDALEQNPKVGFCASKVVLARRPDLLDTAGDYLSFSGMPGKRGHLDRADKPEYNRPQEIFAACAAAALYRREVLQDVGGFDEDLLVNFEDVDLSFRAQLRGHRGLYVPGALALHHLHGTLNPRDRKYVYLVHRNLECVYVKNMPLALLVRTFPLHVLEALVSFMLALGRGQGWAYLQGKGAALVLLPTWLRKRREVQRARTESVAALAGRLSRGWWRLKWERWKRNRALR